MFFAADASTKISINRALVYFVKKDVVYIHTKLKLSLIMSCVNFMFHAIQTLSGNKPEKILISFYLFYKEQTAVLAFESLYLLIV